MLPLPPNYLLQEMRRGKERERERRGGSAKKPAAREEEEEEETSNSGLTHKTVRKFGRLRRKSRDEIWFEFLFFPLAAVSFACHMSWF